MLLNTKLSPDLNWIFESISKGDYNTNHPENYNKFIFIIENTTNYIFFNYLLLIFFIYLIWKITNKYFTIIIISILLVLNCFLYIQKDNIFLVAFGVYFLYVFNPKLISYLEEFTIFIILFLSFLTFPLFGFFLTIGFLLVCKNRIQYLIIFCIISVSFNQWQPLKNQDNYQAYIKLNHVIASDSINISKRVKDYTIIPKMFLIDGEENLECILNYDNANNIINPHGVANIDYIINNNCVNLKSRLSVNDYIAILDKVYFVNFAEYISIKLRHTLQLFVRPYNNDLIKFIIKIFLGPIWLIITVIYLIYTPLYKKLVIIFPVYIHFIFIMMFAPGYDVRYTYPELISIVFLYLSISKNETKNKTLRR